MMKLLALLLALSASTLMSGCTSGDEVCVDASCDVGTDDDPSPILSTMNGVACTARFEERELYAWSPEQDVGLNWAETRTFTADDKTGSVRFALIGPGSLTGMWSLRVIDPSGEAVFIYEGEGHRSPDNSISLIGGQQDTRAPETIAGDYRLEWVLSGHQSGLGLMVTGDVCAA